MGKAQAGDRKLICSGCGRKVNDAHDFREREVRDLPWGKYRTTVIIEVYRVCCPQCGVRVEKVPQLPSKAPFSKRFEESVGLCAKARRYDRLPDSSDWLPAQCGRSTAVSAALECDASQGPVSSNVETSEPLWFGSDRKQETLDEFFRTQLTESQRKRIQGACVDMWRPFTNSIVQWARNCRIVYDKFHVLQHANQAIDEVRRAEFFRKGGPMRGVVKGQRWLLLTSLDESGQQETTAIQRCVRPQPEGDESLPSKGKLGEVVNLPRHCASPNLPSAPDFNGYEAVASSNFVT
jgi:transposase